MPPRKPPSKSARGMRLLMARETSRIRAEAAQEQEGIENRIARRASSQAQLTEPGELLESPIPPQPEEPPVEEGALEAPDDAAPGGGAEKPPEGAQQQPLPLAIALPQQTRRVREQVLPAWYALRYNPGSPQANDPAVADHIMTMNAALTTAEQAMMNQDVGQMLFAYRALERFQV